MHTNKIYRGKWMNSYLDQGTKRTQENAKNVSTTAAVYVLLFPERITWSILTTCIRFSVTLFQDNFQTKSFGFRAIQKTQNSNFFRLWKSLHAWGSALNSIEQNTAVMPKWSLQRNQENFAHSSENFLASYSHIHTSFCTNRILLRCP